MYHASEQILGNAVKHLNISFKVNLGTELLQDLPSLNYAVQTVHFKGIFASLYLLECASPSVLCSKNLVKSLMGVAGELMCTDSPKTSLVHMVSLINNQN